MPATESDDARIGAQQQAPPEVGLGRDVVRGGLVRWVHTHPAMDRSARSRYTDGIEGDRDLAARDLAARDLATQSSRDCYDGQSAVPAIDGLPRDRDRAGSPCGLPSAMGNRRAAQSQQSLGD
jgi:hypothetical protein